MGLLSKAAKNKKAKGETNYVGNAALDSNIYLCTIDNMFLGESKNGSITCTIQYTTESGVQRNETIVMTTNKDNGCKNYYLNRDKEPVTMQGWALVDSILQLTIEESLDEVETELKNCKVWNGSKEVVEECEVITDAIGEQIYLGIYKVKYTKNNGTEGFTNKINKAFCAAEEYEYATVPEIEAEEEEFTFYESWLQRSEGYIDDQTTKEEKGKKSSRRKSGRLGGRSSEDDEGESDAPKKKKALFKK
ncbi:MAG: hypothetical protein Tp152SUR00d2C52646391_24 [Prokaryotic dsDNA virus sp.]|nr:MAG: hypothetical protein Tp152SUR00d2C52646391_24 [Prokaryotic dsDNA virus sp.]|tara:strand:- start:471 stop:1214 length:744 start_codon:yes stop_codon:yes gene_type:complete